MWNKLFNVSIIMLFLIMLAACQPVKQNDSHTLITSLTSETSLEKVSNSIEKKADTPSSPPKEQSKNNHINTELKDYLISLEALPLGIYLKDLKTSNIYQVNDQVIFYGASIAKLPIIYYTQTQLISGNITLDTSFPYTVAVNQVPGAMIAGGTGIMQQDTYEGAQYSVENLFSWSILHSDNLASNMLSYYVGNKNGDDFLTSLTPFYPQPLTEFSKDLSAKTAGELMEAIYQNNIGLDYFNQTDWQHEKLGVLSKNVFHKIGVNDTFNHDVGIIDGESPYVFAFLSDGLSNKEMEDIIKQVDELITKE